MTMKREAVANAAIALAKLLEKPEHGLAVWHDMCERAYQGVLAAASGEDEEKRGA